MQTVYIECSEPSCYSQDEVVENVKLPPLVFYRPSSSHLLSQLEKV